MAKKKKSELIGFRTYPEIKDVLEVVVEQSDDKNMSDILNDALMNYKPFKTMYDEYHSKQGK